MRNEKAHSKRSKDRVTSHPVALALGCLAAFLVLTSLPVADAFQRAGLSDMAALCAHAGILAAFSLGAFAVCARHTNPIRPLLIIAGAALLVCAVPVCGTYLAWCTFTGLAEEVLFCGILYPCLCAASSDRTAPFATAALFAVCHVTSLLPVAGMLMRVVLAAVFSFCMVCLYRRTQRLWIPVLCHAAFDAVFFLLL